MARVLIGKPRVIPLSVKIASIIITIVVVPTLLFLVVFIIPPLITVLVVGFIAAKKVGNKIKSK